MKIGLSLSGGGANGAFHAGAIKALNDYGFDQFDYVAGISAGAIAGSMVNGIGLVNEFYDRIVGRPEEIFDLYFTDYRFRLSIIKAIKNAGQLIKFQSLSGNLKLKRLIEEYSKQSIIPFFGVGVTSLSDGNYYFIHESKNPGKDIMPISILASASMIPIFKPVEEIKSCDGKYTMCADGGLRVISPIINCIQMAKDNYSETVFFEINCRNNNPDKKLVKNNLFQYLLTGDSIKSAQLFQSDDSAFAGLAENVLTIQPKDSTTLPGKLDFSKSSMNYMRELGYSITIEKLKTWGKLQK